MKARKRRKPRAPEVAESHVAQAEAELPLDRMSAFAFAYLQNGFNGVAAARASGHKGKDEYLAVTAWRLLRNTKVQEVLRRMRAEACMDAIEALHLTAEIARGNMADFLSDGRVDLVKADAAGKLHLIRKIKQKTWVERTGEEDEVREVQETTIELYAADQARKLFMQYHGLLDTVRRKNPLEEEEIDRKLAAEIIRVHGEEDGKKRIAALGLKVVH